MGYRETSDMILGNGSSVHSGSPKCGSVRHAVPVPEVNTYVVSTQLPRQSKRRTAAPVRNNIFYAPS